MSWRCAAALEVGFWLGVWCVVAWLVADGVAEGGWLGALLAFGLSVMFAGLLVRLVDGWRP